MDNKGLISLDLWCLEQEKRPNQQFHTASGLYNFDGGRNLIGVEPEESEKFPLFPPSFEPFPLSVPSFPLVLTYDSPQG